MGLTLHKSATFTLNTRWLVPSIMVPLMWEAAERCGVSRSCMSQFALMAVTRRYVSIGGRSLPSTRIKPALRNLACSPADDSKGDAQNGSAVHPGAR